MNSSTFALRIFVFIFCVAFIFEISGREKNNNTNFLIYRNSLTYIIVDSCYKTACIYERDDNPHPVFPRTIYRGEFNIEPINNNFYSLNAELPGKVCLKNMTVCHKHADINNVTAKFNLGKSKGEYLIMAKCIKNGTIYEIAYPKEKELSLPVESQGYEFSIKPAYIDFFSFNMICSGFGHTLKFLNLPQIPNDIFSSSGYVEISLPQFNDDIFDRWCINGEIIMINRQILNDKIIWHGKEFKLYERPMYVF